MLIMLTGIVVINVIVLRDLAQHKIETGGWKRNHRANRRGSAAV
jgi:hypothetical protein